MAGHLHDLGKVLVRRDLLSKVGPLDDEDRAELALHSERGWELLQPVGFLSEVADLVRWHHDAGGPAEGVGRDQQILATAEAYDELMHNGPHGPAMTAEEALARLQKDGYDQQILHALAGVALVDN
jgi:HD-GYP domain-containing protein (c-di-GMP phosphodiesterase class II)